MWTQAFAFVWSSIQREFGFSDKEFGNLFAAFAVGMTLGSFVWGILVDVIGSLQNLNIFVGPLTGLNAELGRRVAFLGTSLITGVFGMCLGAQSSYNGLLVFLAFTGFGIGGNIPIDSTSEYLDHCSSYLHRSLILAIKSLSSIFQRY
jgi:MFS family permease